MPKEFLQICERSNYKTGLLRGLVPFVMYGMMLKTQSIVAGEQTFPLATFFAFTPIMNIFAVMHTKRALINSAAEFEVPASYAKMFAPQQIWKTITLGLGPHLCRNIFMGIALMPKAVGSMDEMIAAVFAVGAVVATHPFEVARVLAVKNNGGSMIPTLQAVYRAEGIAGLYKGFIPRSLSMAPVVVGMQYMIDPRHQNIRLPRSGHVDNVEEFVEARIEKRAATFV